MIFDDRDNKQKTRKELYEGASKTNRATIILKRQGKQLKLKAP